MRPQYPLARLSPAKDELLIIAITRESVVTNDTGPMLDKLLPLSASHEAALQWEGKLTFYFDGWDDDPRETAEIPEIRAYFQTLTKEWPYWLHFCEKVGDTILHVLRLLCHGHSVPTQGGMVGWRFEDLAEVTHEIMRLFRHMNGLYERLDLPETMNERISQEIAQLIGNTLQ
ncbi:hypothetical protein CCR95_04360 [Thiocystis minor]|uniref:hypothetical protein n=1 Tax=Thiocystis minor TaxID=61597 RepID=UPI00191422FB|nr:hypothetical protein [Thiocystis minor]MBK5963341.1 hypothetical protein [Thiocystis minor]